MKSWLAKFRISTALDGGEPLPESLRKKIAADPALERFTRRTEALGRALRNVPRAQSSQHESIMRAVRAAARPERPRRALVPLWLTASAAVAVLAIGCFWAALHHPESVRRQSLDGAVTVVELIEKMPDTMPKMVMAPLSDEWARMDHDLQDTTQVLLASFP